MAIIQRGGRRPQQETSQPAHPLQPQASQPHRAKSVKSRMCLLVVALLVALWLNAAASTSSLAQDLLRWQDSSTSDDDDEDSAGSDGQSNLMEADAHVGQHDRELCIELIRNATQPYLDKGKVPTMMSRQRRRNVRDMMMDLVTRQDPIIPGDWVETGTWKGGASLLAAIVQREALRTPACGNVAKRTIWLADSFEGLPGIAAQENRKIGGYEKAMDPPGSYLIEGGVETVKATFRKHGFATDGTGDVPIRFLPGWFQDTLPDAPIDDIAILRLDGDLYASTLQALFALYRRVRVGGIVIIDDYGHWPQCKKAIDEFFVDANITLHGIDYTGRWFRKEDVHIRVPPTWNTDMISIDPRITEAWKVLAGWHQQTTKQFVGHVGANRYQTYRYAEAMRHVIQRKRRNQSRASRNGIMQESTITSETNTKTADASSMSQAVHVHVCETGFNGGHSAMLFLSFHNPSNNNIDSIHGADSSANQSHNDNIHVHVHYHGWDLGKVGSSRPTAERMTQKFGADYFHVVWGDSKRTLPNVHGNEPDDATAGMMHGKTCDIVIIDGEHKAEGVRNDLRWLLQVSRPGTVVFGDDCAPYHRQVPASKKMLMAWNEVAENGVGSGGADDIHEKRMMMVSVANYRNPQLPSPGFVEAVVVDGETGHYQLGL
eukprot:CAMPEP_0119565922 /NCGR_PEP_ID=MMETSP1352-20130426/31533_1 /TAXON_ID=265584 /ORGANISM="Stauroneis constricta, Strain CCMP1120" /LENGTH=658 /DNA_ID=CAMNT_0007614943 /DNA_START=54 /DNA_END=2030 /DNA_ORIENTATION=-